MKCAYCKSEDIIEEGYFQTAKQEKVQRYYCKSCEVYPKKPILQDEKCS